MSDRPKTTPPFLHRSRVAAKDSGSAGKKAEKLSVQRMGGTSTPGSGALAGAKGDFKVSEFLIENKTTIKDSFQLQRTVLYKIRQEAIECGKRPAVAFQFVNGNGESHKRDRWVIMLEQDFKEMLEG